nr:integrase, catalytic region, zinc finger, CCHC-type, peptidase aspartic, catalytic [Tanacetum cinerariifolium]
RSIVSNTPLSSNSFAARRDCPIHHLVQGAVTIKRVYYVEGLNHNLFSVGQFYDADLEVAFWKSTCFIRDLKGNDLLTAPECQIMALNHASLSPAIQRQENVPQANGTVTTSNELDLLFSPMFAELLNGSSKVVSKSSAVSSANAPNQRQQHTTLLNNHITHAPTCQVTSLAPTVSSSENINQAETKKRDEENTVIRNKSCLVAKGYAQKEGVDFEESFAPV